MSKNQLCTNVMKLHVTNLNVILPTNIIVEENLFYKQTYNDDQKAIDSHL